MHCPRCGQQQVSSELRFCSRCGFPLSGVMELLANDGVIPQYQPPAGAESPKVSPRRKGVQQGVALIFLAAVLTPLLAVLNGYWGFPEIFIALAAIIGFVGGPLRILYASLFEEGAQKVIYVNANQQQQSLPAYQPQTRVVADANRGRVLQPTSAPVSNWQRRPDTSELVHQPSVTENTTKLLEKVDEEEDKRQK